MSSRRLRKPGTLVLMLCVAGTVVVIGSDSTAQNYAVPDNLRVPCDMQIDLCAFEARLNVGDAWGDRDNSSPTVRIANADHYFDGGSGDCGSVNSVGLIDDYWGYGLNFYVGNVFYGNRNTSTGGRFQTRLRVYRETGSPCGTRDSSPLGEDTVTWDGAASSYQQCYSDQRATCWGDFGSTEDPTNCHLPDVRVSRPSDCPTSGCYACYYTEVHTRTCDAGGANCTGWTGDDGKVFLWWE